ncbi:hypothetical protein OU415_02455 [Saccharopolyspora sp. WRP15-2]|uniref:AAA domain-containing protein n=1 Tax=Saccharopolyspora oryzae TaxID=2997343 RepID=A0ABT4UT32_9PSEU|nr:hypothetical protein [Saccharopolyspora oryzae]MDA3624279.1 hypothetical protein [Saccharopolyspora oryzae]
MSEQHEMVRRAIAAGLRQATPPPNARTFNVPAVRPGDPQGLRYARAALRSECDELAATGQGGRNEKLNTAAWKMGRYVGAGLIDEPEVIDALWSAARTAGLGDTEIARTVTRAAHDGTTTPKEVHLEPVDDIAPAYVLEPSTDVAAGPDDAEQPERRTWAPIDLGPVLDGTYQPPEAGLLVRDDSHGLLYPAHIHWFHGESESGKSWVAQITAARTLVDGGRVLYIDHESSASEVVGRLLSLGVPATAIRDRFDYVQPEVAALREAETYAELLSRSYEFAVVDGVTEALVLNMAKSVDNDEIAAWMRVVPRAIARYTGAAVVCIDHVAKGEESRGRFAIGGQHKMAGVDGAAYVVEPAEPLGKGMRGVLVLRIAKDRPGAIRPHCGKWRKSDRTQEAARVIVDSTRAGQTLVTIEPPEQDNGGGFKPTALMERVSRFIEDHPMASQRMILTAVTGKDEYVKAAIEHLIYDGYVTRSTVGSATVHQSVKPYRERGDTDFDGDSDDDHEKAG